MPELPDIQVYMEQLAKRLVGQPLTAVTIAKPFVLRSVDPPIGDAIGRRFTGVRRSGKRIVLVLDERSVPGHPSHDCGEASVARRGALRSQRAAAKGRGRKPPAISAKLALATFTVPTGTLYFTEAGSTRRASLHYVHGDGALAAFDRGGLEVLGADRAEFAARLASENHTLKRSLTDPRLFSGIGNAYSDEILHRARLSPMALSRKLSDADTARLYDATQDVLTEWTARLREAAAGEIPEKVTAFHDEDGRARPLSQAVSGVWRSGTADPVRVERNELLCPVPDWWAAPRGPCNVAAASGRIGRGRSTTWSEPGSPPPALPVQDRSFSRVIVL